MEIECQKNTPDRIDHVNRSRVREDSDRHRPEEEMRSTSGASMEERGVPLI